MAEEVSMSKKGAIGSIRIADEVVGIIAGLAATEIDGVAGMSGGIAGGIAEMLGKKSFTKGVKVEVGEKETAVDLYMIVKYENMTGLTVVEVNVHVQGVSFAEETEEEDARVH